jgi:hypothetical protein
MKSGRTTFFRSIFTQSDKRNYTPGLAGAHGKPKGDNESCAHGKPKGDNEPFGGLTVRSSMMRSASDTLQHSFQTMIV